jgi:hypothetical protein
LHRCAYHTAILAVKLMKKILIEKGLWETLLNDDRFLEYLREEN